MSDTKFSPLLSLARHAQRRRMDMQCDPQWVLDLSAERDTLRAEVEKLREIREIASQCAANGGYLSSAGLIELRELLKK